MSDARFNAMKSHIVRSIAKETEYYIVDDNESRRPLLYRARNSHGLSPEQIQYLNNARWLKP